jgi:hypothetical protein
MSLVRDIVANGSSKPKSMPSTVDAIETQLENAKLSTEQRKKLKKKLKKKRQQQKKKPSGRSPL